MENFNAQRARDIAQLHVTAAQESHDVELTFDRPGISRCDAILGTESLSDTTETALPQAEEALTRLHALNEPTGAATAIYLK